MLFVWPFPYPNMTLYYFGEGGATFVHAPFGRTVVVLFADRGRGPTLPFLETIPSYRKQSDHYFMFVETTSFQELAKEVSLFLKFWPY